MERRPFQRELAARITRSKNALCIGIDPHTENLPPFLAAKLKKDPLEYLKSFTLAHVDAARNSRAPAVKFQSSFFEARGSAGFAALERGVRAAQDAGLFVILDAKRGDIASTMHAYGTMAFDAMGADCLTVVPYLGLDVIDPLMPWFEQGKGIFLVWSTSNPGGTVLQEAALKSGLTVLEHVWTLVEKRLSGAHLLQALGLVAGAPNLPRLEEIGLLKKIAAQPLLMPGVGAQGAVVTEQMRTLLRANTGCLVPISRGISQPEDAVLARTDATWTDYAEAITKAACAAAKSVAL